MSHTGESTARVVPRLELLGAALLFSTGGAAIKACSLGAWQVACFRSAIAGLALLAVVGGARRLWRPREIAVGAAYAATMLLYVGANKLTTAANSIFLQSTAPMYVLLLGPWLLAERARRVDLWLTATIAVGMALFFVGVEPSQATAPDPARGNLLGAAAGVTWALTLIGLRWLGRQDRRTGDGGVSAGVAVVAGNFIAAAVALPFAFPIGPSSTMDWTVVVYLGLFQIGLAYIFLTRGVRDVPALEVSLLLLLEPVANAIWAWLVHGEQPGAWSLAGGTLILAATVGSTMIGRR